MREIFPAKGSRKYSLKGYLDLAKSLKNPLMLLNMALVMVGDGWWVVIGIWWEVGDGWII